MRPIISTLGFHPRNFKHAKIKWHFIEANLNRKKNIVLQVKSQRDGKNEKIQLGNGNWISHKQLFEFEKEAIWGLDLSRPHPVASIPQKNCF